MKQILQNLGSGETILAEVPCPRSENGGYLVESLASLLSIGTEKMLLDFGKANLIEKARQQPDKVKQVLHKVKTDGWRPTMEAVRAKLDQPIPLGYSNVGVVAEIGGSGGENGGRRRPEGRERASVPRALRVGDRVVSNGHHAEVVSVPLNLCARVPEGVSDEQAAFTVVGAIGLQGLRLLQPTLGERVVVMGLGLIGLLCVQMLRAQGCRVLGTDFDERKIELARQFGAEPVNLAKGEDPVAVAEEWTQREGVDGVLITAATKSNEVVHQAATMCRKRGKIVLVGVVGLHLDRSDFYEKELSFQVSCSYGPGRYDPNYEQRGLDYPIGYVRWTEQRNFEAVLQLLAEGKLEVAPLISHRFKFVDALLAYEKMSEGGALGIVLDYRAEGSARDALKSAEHGSEKGGPSGKFSRTVTVSSPGSEAPKRSGRPTLAFVGAGNFTTRTLLPALEGSDCRLKTIVSSSGVSGTHAAKKFGFEQSSSDGMSVFDDDEVDAVFITTPHHTHATFVRKAFERGKHVFVEKPLCLNQAELAEITALAGGSIGSRQVGKSGGSLVMVGFNRRFSPHVVKMKELLSPVREPKSIIITVNAGEIPPDHWTQDPEVGGGRVIGEACHFVDLARHLAGSMISDISAAYLGREAGKLGDSLMVNLSFEDGSIASLQYLARGHKGFPKERVEVFCGKRILQCENFRLTRGFGWRGFKRFKTSAQDKGHRNEMEEFLRALRKGEEAPIPFGEIVEVTEATLQVWNSRS